MVGSELTNHLATLQLDAYPLNHPGVVTCVIVYLISDDKRKITAMRMSSFSSWLI